MERYVPNRDGLLSDFFQELFTSFFDASFVEISQLRQIRICVFKPEVATCQVGQSYHNMLGGDRVVSLPSVRSIDGFEI